MQILQEVCFLRSLNLFISLNQSLQFYAWYPNQINRSMQKGARSNYRISIELLNISTYINKMRERNSGLSLQHYPNFVQDWQDTSLYKTACVQTAYGHRDDIYKLCMKFSVESPRDKPMLFAVVWSKFSSFLSKYWVMLHGRLPFPFKYR